MSKPDDLYPHLSAAAIELLDAGDDQRIRSIQAGTWMGYERAKAVLARMEELLVHPPITRMPNLLLVAPSHNGKTSILEHFIGAHPPVVDPADEVTVCPVLLVEAPEKPDVSAFYSRILDALMAPYKPTASAMEKYSQIKVLFRQMQVRMLIIDEIHHLIAGSLNRQREFRNALKSLGNETKVVIVAAGIEDAYNAFNTDPQMSSRFEPVELPLWTKPKDVAVLLATLERRTPLRKPSNLKQEDKLMALLTRCEGTLGDLCDLFKRLAVDAIRSGAEEIRLARISDLPWVPPSRRKQHQRF